MPHARLEWTQEMVTHPPTPEMVTIRHVQPHPFIILPLRCSTFVTVHDILLAVHFKCSEAIRAAESSPCAELGSDCNLWVDIPENWRAYGKGFHPENRCLGPILLHII